MENEKILINMWIQVEGIYFFFFFSYYSFSNELNRSRVILLGRYEAKLVWFLRSACMHASRGCGGIGCNGYVAVYLRAVSVLLSWEMSVFCLLSFSVMLQLSFSGTGSKRLGAPEPLRHLW